MSGYFLDLGDQPPICLPADLEQSELIDVTQFGDAWRRYYDPSTETEYEGEVYARRYMGQALADELDRIDALPPEEQPATLEEIAMRCAARKVLRICVTAPLMRSVGNVLAEVTKEGNGGLIDPAVFQQRLTAILGRTQAS